MISRSSKLFRIRGGVHPDSHKDATANLPIRILPIPERLYVPLQQHIGAPAEPVVKKGQRVLKGELLANSQGALSAPVHAPTSGTIVKIGKHTAPHPSGLPVRTIVLAADGKDEWMALPDAIDPFTLDSHEIARRVAMAGIVGMGGAAFPSAVKLALAERYKLHTLVINGSECEPYLTCDDRLMREHADDIIDGICIMMRALEVDKAIVGIEANKPDAVKAMKQAAADYPAIDIVTVPTRYPMGSEKHLIQALTGKETPARSITADIGVVVHNVATAQAVHNAVRHHRPLISRVVTVAGAAVNEPGNLLAAIGTPVSFLLNACGGTTEDLSCLLSGGPMMGQPLPDASAPIIKGSSAVLALSKSETDSHPVMPCIRCGACVQACPCGLVPLEMASHVRKGDIDGASEIGLMDCVSCGSCSYVCPSRIPLVQFFNHAKGAFKQQLQIRQKQELTKELATSRTERMERLKQAKRETMARHKADAAAKKAAEQGASA